MPRDLIESPAACFRGLQQFICDDMCVIIVSCCYVMCSLLTIDILQHRYVTGLCVVGYLCY